jgi:8-amino-3,8-dideoxy-alpha-D-manno-octulosonate transaminase
MMMDKKKNHKITFPDKLLGASLIGKEELQELTDVINERSPFRYYGLGTPEKVSTFEKEVRDYFNVKYALALSSGSAALVCSVAALGLGPGDEIIIPAFSWYSDYNAIVLNGAIPVFANINDSLSLDPTDVEKKITKNTKALIVIHYQGGPANMDELVEISKKHNLYIIEDCAQAFGGSYKGKLLGTIGDVAISSFQNNKMITSGEGGVLITNTEDFFVRAVRYHDLGFVRPFYHDQINNKLSLRDEYSFVGNQFRMSELQGACILAQFRKLPFIIETCRKNHEKLRTYIESSSRLTVRPHITGDCGITLFINCGSREKSLQFAQALENEGVPIGPSSYCTNIVDKHPVKSTTIAYPEMRPQIAGVDSGKEISDPSEDFLQTDEISEKYLAIGIGVKYENEHILYIIEALKKAESTLFKDS